MDSSIENSKPDKELYHKAETKAESHLLNSLSTPKLIWILQVSVVGKPSSMILKIQKLSQELSKFLNQNLISQYKNMSKISFVFSMGGVILLDYSGPING